MTNEEFQKTILEQLNELTKGQRELQKSIAGMENKFSEKIDALYDAREVQFDVNERICSALNRIESKMDRLTLKVSAHESELRRAK